MSKMAQERILDLRGVISPFAILKAGSVFREMKVHETMEILLSDFATIKDLSKVLHESTMQVTFNPSFCMVKVKKEGTTKT